MQDHYKCCELCPRNCRIDRHRMPGRCGCTAMLRAARAALHYYEEPFLSGTAGSGTVFFSGCSLGCVYCQNGRISREYAGSDISGGRLAEVFLEQQARGAHNLNLVTGTHYTPDIAQAVREARNNGLTIPVVWNSSGYEKPETLHMLKGLVDIFLPDLKTLSPELGKRYMDAPDYPLRAKEAIDCMVRMCPEVQFEPFGDRSGAYAGEGVLMKRGVTVRHLVIPGKTEDSKDVIKYLYETYGDRIWISLMSQYTPVGAFARENTENGLSDAQRRYPELCRTLSQKEYDEVVDYAIELGIENCMIQEGETASDSFIPDFDGTGL